MIFGASGTLIHRITLGVDMFLISSELVETTIEVEILPFFGSDHSSVYLRFSLSQSPARGRGVRKMNTSLLSDAFFWNQVREF